MLRRPTYSQKPSEITREWYIIDADGVSLGRIASVAAQKLIGKDKPSYTPHMDGGDSVIVTNAAKVGVTGNKLDAKVYYRHSSYPGSLKERTLAEQLERDARKVIESAVYGMLPKNKLRDARMKRLKVYRDAEHEHNAQQPQELKVGK
ncbi:50S ribosomal protein L13 [Candidatus Saccharibacteria bacterium]|jgi:large subunit ribosomal protein L13|nr:50S ribosomal protein L13 [Candidatus Saccharibacteria bacterium]